MEELSVFEYFSMTFQHDGAPAHYARPMREYLNSRFPEWIGRGGPVPWPAHSPDLTHTSRFFRVGGVMWKIWSMVLSVLRGTKWKHEYAMHSER